MTEFRKAPEGQPTSNIRLCLQKAEDEVFDWNREIKHHTERLEVARRMAAKWDHLREEYSYQLVDRHHEGRDD